MTRPLRVLLDENLPVKLKYRLIDDTIFVSTVRDQNWLGKKNGELLSAMQSEDFDVLISNDKYLGYQQNASKFSLIILQLNAFSNRYDDLLPLVSVIKETLLNIKSELENNQLTSFLEIRNLP